jgi:hypothetical protein
MVRQAVQTVTKAWRVPLDKTRLGGGWKRWAPAGLVAMAVFFNLVVLRAEITQVPNVNDGPLHAAMMQVALHNIAQGKLPLGGWFPNLGLGSAQFLHYQTFPHVMGALASTIFGTANVYYWSLYLLLSLWPVSVYAGARLLGWDRWIAATAALVSPLLVSVAGYGFEDGSYAWRGFGLWPQLWSMWLLPLAWGLSWRAVDQGRNYAQAALVIALTIACHFMTGTLALLVLVPWVLIDPSQLRRRLVRASVVGGGALLIASWVLVPLVTEGAWSGNLEYFQGTFYQDSYGAPQVLSWLFSGQLYDSGRFPIVSLLAGVGLLVCISRVRRDTRARALIGAWTLSLVLYFGRPALGPLLHVLPGSSDLQLHRYISGVHLAGLMLAGVGALWLARLLLPALRRALPRLHVTAAAAGIAVAGVALLYPAWSQLASYNANGADLMSVQQQADATDGADLAVLINQVKAAGDGRAYGGASYNWGREYTIGIRPVYLELENADVDAVGQGPNTQSLSSDVEVHFAERNLADYDLFNVKYLILPQDHPPPVPAYLLARSGRHTLWEVATSGYLEVVDTIAPPIVADRNDIGPQTAGFMESNALQQLRFPTVAFNGAAAASATLGSASTSPSSAGTVTTQSAALEDGLFSGEVTANRRAVVLLKTTAEPGWQVSVDGVSAQPIMVAPSFVGVTVPPGPHSVVFHFATYPYYAPLLALGLITFLVLMFVPRRPGARAIVVVDEPVAMNEPVAKEVRARRVAVLQLIEGWRPHRKRGRRRRRRKRGRIDPGGRRTVGPHHDRDPRSPPLVRFAAVSRAAASRAVIHLGAVRPVQLIRPLARRVASPTAGVLLLYAIVAVLLTLTAWQSPATTYIGGCCDPEQAMWHLRWVPYAISHLSDPFYTQQLNAPAGVNLMWGSSMIVCLAASPITLLFGPIVAYNIVITAAIALSAWCAFLAVRRYAHGIVGPLIGGAVYGFSPYVVPQATQHMGYAVAFVTPLFLLVLDELLRRRRRSPLLLGAALGILAFIQFLTAEELVLTSAIVGGVMVVALAVQRRQEIRATLQPLFQALVAALLIFTVLVAWPIAVQFLGPQQLHGVLHNADLYSTDLLNIVLPTQFQLIAPDAATTISTHFSGFDWEANAYIGLLPLLLLAAFTARRWSDIRVRTAAIVGMVALVFSLGPHLEIGGQSTGWPLPLGLLSQLPVVGDAQPNRIAVFMWLAIAVLVTIAIDGALSRRWRHAAPRLGAIALALATVLPAPLPASTVPVPAFFQNWQQEGIPDGTTMLVAPFVNGGAAVDPMVWAAVAGDGFRMPEAYAAIPQADGTTAYGPIPTELASAMQNIQHSGVTIAARGDVRDQIGQDLQAAGVSDVVVGPMNNRAQMVAFFTDLFGRPPDVVDGVELWRGVDSAGVVPA